MDARLQWTFHQLRTADKAKIWTRQHWTWPGTFLHGVPSHPFRHKCCSLLLIACQLVVALMNRDSWRASATNVERRIFYIYRSQGYKVLLALKLTTVTVKTCYDTRNYHFARFMGLPLDLIRRHGSAHMSDSTDIHILSCCHSSTHAPMFNAGNMRGYLCRPSCVSVCTKCRESLAVTVRTWNTTSLLVNSPCQPSKSLNLLIAVCLQSKHTEDSCQIKIKFRRIFETQEKFSNELVKERNLNNPRTPMQMTKRSFPMPQHWSNLLPSNISLHSFSSTSLQDGLHHFSATLFSNTSPQLCSPTLLSRSNASPRFSAFLWRSPLFCDVFHFSPTLFPNTFLQHFLLSNTFFFLRYTKRTKPKSWKRQNIHHR